MKNLTLLSVWEWVDHKAGPTGRRGTRRWTIQRPAGKTVSILETNVQVDCIIEWWKKKQTCCIADQSNNLDSEGHCHK